MKPNPNCMSFFIIIGINIIITIIITNVGGGFY